MDSIEKLALRQIDMQLDRFGVLYGGLNIQFGDVKPARVKAGNQQDTDLFSQISPPAVDEKNRSVDGVANAGEVSRTNYDINIDGIDLKSYKQNPVVLACHQHFTDGLMPGVIAQVGSVFIEEGKRLRFKKMRFDTDPISDAWWNKIVGGFVRMVSIGFHPISNPVWHSEEKGGEYRWWIEFAKTELTEISVVPVGANRKSFIGQSEQATDSRLDRLEKQIQELSKQISDAAIGDIRSRIDRLHKTVKGAA